MPETHHHHHESKYKNRAKSNMEQLRREREQGAVELRKERRNEQLSKRRNLNIDYNNDVINDGAGGVENCIASASSTNVTDDEHKHVEIVESLMHVEHYPLQIDAWLCWLRSPEPDQRLKGARAFRKVLSRDQCPPIDAIINSGAVPDLIACLDIDDAACTNNNNNNELRDLQVECAWALTNIASGNNIQTASLLKGGVLQPLLSLLRRSTAVKVLDQAVWLLGNIVGDSHETRVFVQRYDPLPTVLDVTHRLCLMYEAKCGEQNDCDHVVELDALRTSVWALSNLARDAKKIMPVQQILQMVPVAQHFLMNRTIYEDKDLLTDTCWVLSYVLAADPKCIQPVVDSGVTARLVELMLCPSEKLATPALRCIGNIVTGNEEQTQTTIDASVLPALCSILQHGCQAQRKDACWTVSNILGGTIEQMQAVFDEPKLIDVIVETLTWADFKTRKEAAWAVANVVTGGTTSQVSELLQARCLPPLCDLLTVCDARVVTVVLNAIAGALAYGEIERINGSMNSVALEIEECGGLDKLEFLQNHENFEIYDRAKDLIESYFSDDELLNESDLTAAPNGGGNSIAFEFEVLPTSNRSNTDAVLADSSLTDNSMPDNNNNR